MGDVTKQPGIQETARVLRLKGDVYVSHEATAVWRSNDPSDSFVNKAFAAGELNKWRRRWLQLLERRQAMALRSCYIEKYGMDDAEKFSARFGSTHQERIERALLLCGKYVVLTPRSLHWRIVQILKGIAFRAMIPSRIDLRKVQTH
jgi:hypothetical protein